MSERTQIIHALRDLRNINLDGLRFRLIDARGMIVGRLAVEIAKILQGKDKPTFNPKHNTGDVVVVINASHLHFTNDQWKTKIYRYHTRYPGGMRERTADEQWDHDPTSILRKAVRGMLPSNRMREFRMDKLKIFAEEDHPYKALPVVPYIPAARTLNLPGLGWQLPPGLEPMNREKYAFRVQASPWLHQYEDGDSTQSESQIKSASRRNKGLAGITKLLTQEEKQALEKAMAEQRKAVAQP